MSSKNKKRKLKMRRLRGKTSHLQRGFALEEEQPPRILTLLSFDVTYEAIEDDTPESRAMKAIDPDRISELHDLLYSHPAKAIEPLRQLLAEHPKNAILTGWLIAALRTENETDEANSLTEQNYRDNPSYLFACIDHCRLLMSQNEMAAVETLLDKKIHLKLMYPHRNLFHITEVVAFQGLMIEFFLRKGNTSQATIHLGILKQFAPDHPATKSCSTMIARAQLMQGMKKLVKSMFRGRPLLR